MDSPDTQRPLRRPKRYRLVSASRAELQGARVRRFQLMQTEALTRLERPTRAARTAE